ncbi:magnesium transporter [Candidatus Entotheonella palauensis]|nr:magnesium transporter [Candidatus Entotheonella palauensis]
MQGMSSTTPERLAAQRNLPVEATRRLLRRNAYVNLVRLLGKLHGRDSADIVTQLPIHEQCKLLEHLPTLELVTSIFTYLNEETRAQLMPQLSIARLTAIVRHLPTDDAADILVELPQERLAEMLDQLPDTLAEQINRLLAYDPQTAGGLMTTDYFAVEDTRTTAEVLEQLRRRSSRLETVFYLYVVDAEHRLVGVVSLRQLVTAEPHMVIRDLMETEVICVTVDEDQAHIAHLITQYDFLALPVVDYSHRLAGIVTVDDIIDVISEEATEDMLRMAGVNPDAMLEHASRGNLRHRLPWLSVSWVGGLLASYIIDANETTLSSMVMLAAFFPVIIGMGGNAATQSLAVAVRGLATGSIAAGDMMPAIAKEGRIGLSLGVIYGVLLGAVAWFWQGTVMLGLVVGVAIWSSMSIAAILGGVLPLCFARMRIDPAVASGPFLTTAIDVIGLAIYLTTARLLLAV